MSLPRLQLQPISTTHYYTSGDVKIEPGAAIAPGVLIQADPNSRVVVKTGACIGVGAVLHAHGGLLQVCEGANVGAEVLLIGQVVIGANACVGTAATVMDRSIGAGQLVPPGTLLGDHSRVVSIEQPPAAIHTEVQHTVFQQTVVQPTVPAATVAASPPISATPPQVPTPAASPPVSPELPAVQPLYSNPFNPNAVKTTAFPLSSSEPTSPIPQPPDPAPSDPIGELISPTAAETTTDLTQTNPTEVYGQAYVQRFLFKMFPQRSPDGNNPDTSSSNTPP